MRESGRELMVKQRTEQYYCKHNYLASFEHCHNSGAELFGTE